MLVGQDDLLGNNFIVDLGNNRNQEVKENDKDDELLSYPENPNSEDDNVGLCLRPEAVNISCFCP